MAEAEGAGSGRNARLCALASLLALAAVLSILLGESLFGGKVLTQADALYEFEPWRSVAPEGFVSSNPLLLDQATGWLPWMDFEEEERERHSRPKADAGRRSLRDDAAAALSTSDRLVPARDVVRAAGAELLRMRAAAARNRAAAARRAA